MSDLPEKPIGNSISANERLAGWLQGLAFELIANGSSGMAKTVALAQLRATGIEPTEDQLKQVELEMRKKGEEFAKTIMEIQDDDQFQSDDRQQGDSRAGNQEDHPHLRGEEDHRNREE